MAKTNIRSGILGIIILVIGVIVGLILIDQTQDFSNKAREKVSKTYTVCHKSEVSGGSVWEEIEVNQEELSTHLNHGDIFGKCPDIEE